MSKIVDNAITSVMADIQPLLKGDKNSHGNYAFASVDDFLAMTRPLCAKHKLCIIQDEEECKTMEGWLLMRYRFTISSGGETHPDRPARSILVSSKMGPQAFGAAQSYVLKQFLRSLFQISTGDQDDLDAFKAVPLPSNVVDPRGDVSGVDQGEVDKYVAIVREILDRDLDEYDMADALRAEVHADMVGRNELYMVLADSLAKEKVIGKSKWKEFINLKRDAA
jgi:hypothetical protein